MTTKKTLLIFVFSILTLAKTFAGDITDKKNLFGFLGGFSINTLNIEDQEDEAKNNVKAGGMVGFAFEHRFERVVAIEAEVLYNNKGAAQKWNDNFVVLGQDVNNKGSYKLNFHSVEVPILIKAYVGKKKIFNIYTGGFVSYAFNVQSKYTTTVTNRNTGTTTTDKRTENNLLSKDNNPEDGDGDRLYRAFDAGVNVGFEFVSKRGFGAGFRFEKGLVDFTNSKYQDISLIPDHKKITHTGLHIYALWKF